MKPLQFKLGVLGSLWDIERMLILCLPSTPYKDRKRRYPNYSILGPQSFPLWYPPFVYLLHLLVNLESSGVFCKLSKKSWDAVPFTFLFHWFCLWGSHIQVWLCACELSWQTEGFWPLCYHPIYHLLWCCDRTMKDPKVIRWCYGSDVFLFYILLSHA